MQPKNKGKYCIIKLGQLINKNIFVSSPPHFALFWVVEYMEVPSPDCSFRTEALVFPTAGVVAAVCAQMQLLLGIALHEGSRPAQEHAPFEGPPTSQTSRGQRPVSFALLLTWGNAEGPCHF